MILFNFIQFLFKKYLKLIKNWFFLVKKIEIQVIAFMSMLTRSSERIFNPMRDTGFKLNIRVLKILVQYLLSTFI